MPVDMNERGQALENEYFRRREQELIAKMKEKIAGESAVNLEIICPMCNGTLIETDFEGIKIDVCDKCSGVWLDAGELAQLVDKDEEKGWFGKMFG
jgi:hypothetical protein